MDKFPTHLTLNSSLLSLCLCVCVCVCVITLINAFAIVLVICCRPFPLPSFENITHFPTTLNYKT